MRELRAQSLAEALDLAVAILRTHPRVFAVLAVVTYVVPNSILNEMLAVATDGDPESLVGLALLPLVLVFYALMTGAMTTAVADDLLEAGPDVGRSLRQALRSSWHLSVASLLYAIPVLFGIMAGLIAIAAGGQSALTSETAFGVVGGLFLLLLGLGTTALTLFLIAGLFLYAPVIVIEGLGPIAGFRRCWRLMRNHRARVFGLVLLWTFVPLLFSALIEMAVPQIPIARSIASAAADGLLLGYLTIAEATIYFDVRVREEAFDLELLAKTVGADAVAS